MTVFSLQRVHCQICGKEFETDFCGYGGYGQGTECCSKACHDELKWRRILSVMGKPYHPRPEEIR